MNVLIQGFLNWIFIKQEVCMMCTINLCYGLLMLLLWLQFVVVNGKRSLRDQVKLLIEVLLYPLHFLCSLNSINMWYMLFCSLEIVYLRLVKLDISENRISTLPVELRTMTTLVDLNLSHNPLTSPPSYVSVYCLL